jgi:hypothetical protein
MSLDTLVQHRQIFHFEKFIQGWGGRLRVQSGAASPNQE